jgi:pimeloyl-ACP methyl ester carboxylesterase
MGLGWPAAMWFRQVPALAERYRVLLVDNRGAGHTGDVVGAPYSVATMAADVAAVLDAAAASPAHVIGISMGGLIAQELALSHPQKVRSLVLMATHAGVGHMDFSEEATQMLAQRVGMSAQEAAELSIPFNYAPQTPRALIEEDWAVRMPLACTPAGYLAQLSGSPTWTSYDRLADLDLPTLVVHGAGDRLVLLSNGETLAKAIPGAQLTVIDDANHVLTTDKAEEVNTTLLAWLDEQP